MNLKNKNNTFPVPAGERAHTHNKVNYCRQK